MEMPESVKKLYRNIQNKENKIEELSKKLERMNIENKKHEVEICDILNGNIDDVISFFNSMKSFGYSHIVSKHYGYDCGFDSYFVSYRLENDDEYHQRTRTVKEKIKKLEQEIELMRKELELIKNYS